MPDSKWSNEKLELVPEEPAASGEQSSGQDTADAPAEFDINELIATQISAESLLPPISKRLRSYLLSIKSIGYQEAGLRVEEAQNLKEIITLITAETMLGSDPETARQLIERFESALKFIVEDLETYKNYCLQELAETVLPEETAPYLAKFQETFPHIPIYLGEEQVSRKKYYEITAKLFSLRYMPLLEKHAIIPPVITTDSQTGQPVSKTPLIGEIINQNENDLRFGTKTTDQISEALAAVFANPDHQKTARLMTAFLHCPGQLNNSVGIAETLKGAKDTVEILEKHISEIKEQITQNPSGIAKQETLREAIKKYEMYKGLLEKTKGLYLSSLKFHLIEQDKNSPACTVERSIAILKGLLNPPPPKLQDQARTAVDHKSPEI